MLKWACVGISARRQDGQTATGSRGGREALAARQLKCLLNQRCTMSFVHGGTESQDSRESCMRMWTSKLGACVHRVQEHSLCEAIR